MAKYKILGLPKQKYQKGGKPDPKTMFYTVEGSDGVYRKVNGKWEVDWNKSGNFQPLSKGDVAKRTAVLNSQAKPLYDPVYDDMYSTQRQQFTPKPVNKPTITKAPTAQDKLAQEAFNKSFQVTNKSKMEGIEDKIQKDVADYIRYHNENYDEPLTKEEINDAYQNAYRSNYINAGVYKPVMSGSVANPYGTTELRKNLISLDPGKAPRNLSLGDYVEKGWDVVTNPLDYASYALKPKGTVTTPWNMTNYENRLEAAGVEDPVTANNNVNKAIDFATWFLPAGAAAQGLKMVPGTVNSIGRAFEKPSWENTGNALWDAGMTALSVAPGFGIAKNLSRGASSIEDLRAIEALRGNTTTNPFQSYYLQGNRALGASEAAIPQTQALSKFINSEAPQLQEFPVSIKGSLLPEGQITANRLLPEPGPQPENIRSSTVLSDAQLQDALTAANTQIDRLQRSPMPDTQTIRMYEAYASELRSNLDARLNYTNSKNQLQEARNAHSVAGLEETKDALNYAKAKYKTAKENLKISEPDYFIDETARRYLDTERQRTIDLANSSIDLTRRVPNIGVTTYESTMPALSQREALFETALGDYNINEVAGVPVQYSEETMEALRRRPSGVSRGQLTYGARLRSAQNPVDFVNRLRDLYANGAINKTVYTEIANEFQNALSKVPNAGDIAEIDNAKLILEASPKKPYSGSALSRDEALNELKSINEDDMNAILSANYGYTLDDLDFIFHNPNISDEIQTLAMNQILDDYTAMADYGMLNPHAPVISFRNQEIIAPQLKSTDNVIDLLNLPEKTADIIKKTSYKGSQDLTTGTVFYAGTHNNNLHTIRNKDYILNNNALAEELEAYEEAYAKLLSDSNVSNANPTFIDVRNRLEDLRSTKWLRTEFAAELRAAGLDPKEIDRISIITTGPSSKSLISGDGEVIGTLNFSKNTYEGQPFAEIASTGINSKFHGYGLKNSKYKTWEGAEKHLAKRLLDESLSTITNPADKKNPIVLKSLTKKANDTAAAEIARMQANNANKFGEAMYRGVHHGIKDTRAGIGTKRHFALTSIKDPITGEIISRKRAEDYWLSQMRQFNEQGVPKAGVKPGPITENDHAWGVEQPIFIFRKLGGDVSKLSRFTK